MKKIAALLIASILGLSTLPALAAMVNTQDVLVQQQMMLDKEQVKALLDNDTVKEKMVSLGVQAEQVNARIDQMTPSELAQLNDQLQNMPAGADVLGLAVLIFIVFIITDAIGATDLFPFVHPVR